MTLFKPTCETCRFAQVTEIRPGLLANAHQWTCHRRSPQVFRVAGRDDGVSTPRGGYTGAAFPRVTADEWCGEWEADS